MRAVPIGEIQADVPVQEGMRRIIPTVRPSDIGESVEQLATTAMQAQRSMQTKDAAVYVGKNIAQARVAAEQTFLDAQGKSSDDIQKDGGFTPSVMKGFTAATQQMTDEAPNGIAKRMMQEHLQALGADLQIRAMKQDAANRVIEKATSAQTSARTAASAVELNPDSWQAAGSEQHASIANMGLPPEETTKLQSISDGMIRNAAARGYAKQNPESAVNRLKDANDPLFSSLSLPEREETETFAKNQWAHNQAQGVVDTYRNLGPTQGAAALKGLDKANLPDDVKRATYQNVEAGLGQWHAEARQTHADSIMALEDRLGSGKTTPDDRGAVMGLYRSGAFTAEQAGETLGRIDKAQEKKVDDDAIYQYASESYRNGVALDPKDEHITKAMDAVFTVATNNVAPGSPEWINRASDIGQKTGVTPPSAVSWARTQLIGGDPQSAANAANAIQRITDANPRGAPLAIDEHTRAMARLINDATHAGTDPQVAIENARKLTSLPDAERQRLDELYKQKQLASKAPGDLSNQLKDPENGFRPHFWNGIPDVPPQMQGQFEDLRKEYFQLTGGNADQASKLATADLKNTWGITQVNGQKEFMQFAPEAMNPGLTTQAIRADLEASAKGHTDDPSKVRLLTTADTFQSGGQRWAIGVPDKFGAYSALTDSKGRVIPYQLPNGTQAFKDQVAKASADGMARLHQQQAIEHERERNELGEMQAQGRQQGAF